MIPRPEYPRPQFVRKKWINLNGKWDFAFDDENIGVEKEWYRNDFSYDQSINVPYAYQSKMSGIQDTSFHDYVWYRRNFKISSDWKNQRIILHFGAVDYRVWVYVNEKFVGYHEGGHVSFSFDITNQLNWKDNETIVVRVEDPSTDESIPRGKQFWKEKSDGIWYTRTTGIWQTVWIEPVNQTRISNLKFTPNIDDGDISCTFNVLGDFKNKKVHIEISFRGEQIISDTIEIIDKYNKRIFNIFNLYIFRTASHDDGWTWTPDNPNLFDVKLTLEDQKENALDEIESYFGMRKVHNEDGKVYLNNKPYYQKLILDQGYWPDGLLTAPTDEDFKKDIELALEMGFNGCRKHQKVEDPRFLYWADHLGFLVWGECPANISYNEEAAARLTREWIEIIERDYNHPSIIVWVPLNESWGVPNIRENKQQQSHSLALYHLIHSLDTSRLVISNDGWELTKTDICAIHNYQHGTKEEKLKNEQFRQSLFTKEDILKSTPAHRKVYANRYEHQGEPILLTEFGGIGYKIDSDSGWGYTSVKSEKEFIQEYKRIMDAVYSSKVLHGYCYTQLTDVEQEINGLLTYDRQPKCDLSIIKRINDDTHCL